ncbi:MAG: vitamin K epoxide reductase family protein [Alphaproteobacteria bacterium]|nr:vitamin K epoxide reductase family protein [Alphaproteobacteria bacterium]
MELLLTYLKLLRIKFNRSTVINFLNYHPYNPSLLSFTDLLDHFKISNQAIRINKNSFPKIPTPFIAKTSSSEGDFCLVTKIHENTITYTNEKQQTLVTELIKFYKQYSGVVLIAEKNENSQEPNYNQNKFNYYFSRFKLYGLLVIIIILLGNSQFFNHTHLNLLPILILKIVGVFISIILLIQSLQINNKFIAKFCSTHSGNGCENILNSNASKIFNGFISWSEIGFVYFASTLTFLLINPVNSNSLVFVLGILCLPFTFYSIYYQSYIAKKWCKLCILIQILFWLETITCIVFNPTITLNINFSSITIYLFITIFITFIWLVLKPLFLNLNENKKLKLNLQKFTTDYTIFSIVLKENPLVSKLNDDYKLILGKANASNELIIVFNPFCTPCLVNHNQLEKSFLNDTSNIKLSFVIMSDKAGVPIQEAMINTYLQNSSLFLKCLRDWFSQKYSFNNFLKIYNAPYTTLTKDFILHQNQWLIDNEISQTPSIYYNNYSFPFQYSYENLKYFIENEHNFG